MFRPCCKATSQAPIIPTLRCRQVWTWLSPGLGAGPVLPECCNWGRSGQLVTSLLVEL